MNDPNIFPKGTHIVLLSNCDSSSVWEPGIPNNYIYRLHEDSSTFSIMLEKDAQDNENGWSIHPNSSFDKMKLRKATKEEILAYKKYGVCSVEKAKDFIIEYQIY